MFVSRLGSERRQTVQSVSGCEALQAGGDQHQNREKQSRHQRQARGEARRAWLHHAGVHSSVRLAKGTSPDNSQCSDLTEIRQLTE